MEFQNNKFPSVFHVGCMKTGTTTLQDLWKNDPRINLILHSRYFNTAKFESDFDYTEVFKTGEGLIDLESDENISRRTGKMLGLEQSLKRIASVNPKAKIVFTVRHQKGMLLSMYKHIIRQTNKSYTMDEFIKSKEGISFIETIRYDKVLETTLAFFPKNQIYFFRWEDFKSNPNEFLKSFYNEIFEIEFDPKVPYSSVNIGRSDQHIRCKRLVNKWKISSNDGSSEGILARTYNGFLDRIVLRILYRLNRSKKKIYHWQNFSNHKELSKEFDQSNTVFEGKFGEDLFYQF